MSRLPCSLADVDPATCDGFAAHFARFGDVHGETIDGLGSMRTPDPEAAQVEEELAIGLVRLLDDLPDLSVPCCFDIEQDRSGAFLVRQSAGAVRLRAGDERATTGSFDLPLPVPLVEWQEVWAWVP